MGRSRRLLSNVIVTSARPRERRDAEPLKMTSAISPPRRLLALCSPRIQRTASTTFDLPEPFGPTMAVMPALKSNCVLSAKLLKPTSSRRFSMPHQKRHSVRVMSRGRRQRRPAFFLPPPLRGGFTHSPSPLAGEASLILPPPLAGEG